MVQLMPQPFKHPKTGVFYYRKVVPQPLRKTLGRTEFRISLGTKDPRQAKRLYLEKAAEVEARLAQAGGGPVTLTHKQVLALAGRWYTEMAAEYDENPGDENGWDEWAHQLRDAYHEGKTPEAMRPFVERVLSGEGLILDERSRAELEVALLVNAIELTELQIRKVRGDYSPDPLVSTIPAWVRPGTGNEPPACALVSVLFERYANERRLADKTRYSWPRILKKLTDHVGHEDIGRMTDTDMIRWKDSLVAAGLQPSTIGNHLIIARAFFAWARSNKYIASNPAAAVEYKVKRDPKTAKLSYSDDDARLILGASRREREAHKRWVPWLAAFTGARCDELCGAMASDVLIQDGVNVLRIDPVMRESAASVKNETSIRTVPLHPAIIAEGFLDYVRGLPKNGPLFPKLSPDRFGKRGGNGSKSIGRWVRKLGINDPRKQPSHAWRHRFADQCRRYGVPTEIRYSIEGRAGFTVGSRGASRDAGSAYGSEGYPLTVLAEAVSRLPNPMTQG